MTRGRARRGESGGGRGAAPESSDKRVSPSPRAALWPIEGETLRAVWGRDCAGRLDDSTAPAHVIMGAIGGRKTSTITACSGIRPGGHGEDDYVAAFSLRLGRNIAADEFGQLLSDSCLRGRIPDPRRLFIRRLAEIRRRNRRRSQRRHAPRRIETAITQPMSSVDALDEQGILLPVSAAAPVLTALDEQAANSDRP